MYNDAVPHSRRVRRNRVFWNGYKWGETALKTGYSQKRWTVICLRNGYEGHNMHVTFHQSARSPSEGEYTPTNWMWVPMPLYIDDDATDTH